MQALSEHMTGYFSTHAPISPAFNSFLNTEMEISNNFKLPHKYLKCNNTSIKCYTTSTLAKLRYITKLFQIDRIIHTI